MNLFLRADGPPYSVPTMGMPDQPSLLSTVCIRKAATQVRIAVANTGHWLTMPISGLVSIIPPAVAFGLGKSDMGIVGDFVEGTSIVLARMKRLKKMWESSYMDPANVGFA